MTEAARLVADYVAESRDYDPVAASRVGLTAFDGRLPNPGRDRGEETAEKRRAILNSLQAIEPLALNEADRLDRAFAIALIEADLVGLAEQPWATRPDHVVGQVVQGIYQIVTRPSLDGTDRWPALLSRLRQAPTLLRESARHLDDRAAPHVCELARRGAEDGARFLGRLPHIARSQQPALVDELATAVVPAQAALVHFAAAVAEVESDARGSVAIGPERYDTLLRSFHRVPYDHKTLLAMGEEMIDHFQGELTACAREIDPDRSWPDIVATLKDNYPNAADVIPEYRNEIARSRAFVEEHNLVSIPSAPDEAFEVTETPAFMRSTIPFGFVSMAPIFSTSGRSMWHITLPTPESAPDRRAQTLQGHNRWNTWAITFHEGYPGHHLHALHLKRVKGDIRRQFTTSVFVEGWGLYTEDLMAEQGYFTDPRARLMQLVNSLWRAVRVVVDTGIHTRSMAVSEAATMLVQISRLEPANAIVEAGRYAITPTYAASYLVGKLRLLDLRRRYFARYPDTDLRRFHDRLLGFGAIPPDVIEGELLRQTGQSGLSHEPNGNDPTIASGEGEVTNDQLRDDRIETNRG